ncbi:MAG: hypothetical protein IPK03_15620 [Bacteroidetes bacterium]|nr:hypothetical protein [Bacteroidota bacterium]
MGKKQIILLVFAIVTTMAIYLFFPVGTQNNNNNQAKGGAMRDQAPAEEKIFTIEAYIAEVNAALTPDLKRKSTEFTSSIEKTNNFDQNIKDYTSLVDLYSKAEKPEIAAYYIYKKPSSFANQRFGKIGRQFHRTLCRQPHGRALEKGCDEKSHRFLPQCLQCRYQQPRRQSQIGAVLYGGKQ